MTKLFWKGFCTNEDVEVIILRTAVGVSTDFGVVMLMQAMDAY